MENALTNAPDTAQWPEDSSHRARGLLRSVLAGTSWNAGGQLFRLVLTLGLTPVIVHGLGLAQYGVYSLVMSVYVFLTSFDGGITPTAGRYFAVYAGVDDRKGTTRLLLTLVLLVLLFGTILSVSMYFLAPLIVPLFHMPFHLRSSAVFLLRLVGFLVGAALLANVFGAVIQARHKYALVNVTSSFSYAVMTVGLAFIAHTHRSVKEVGVLLIIQQVVLILLIFPSACRFLDRRYIGILNWDELKGVLSFAWKAQSTGLASLINTEVDTLLIALLLPIQTVGLYNIGSSFAVQLTSVATNALVPIRNHLGSTFGKLGPEMTLGQFKEMQKWWVIAVTGWGCVGIGASYFGITTWLGPRFELSAVICVILLASYTINLYTGMTTIYLNVIGRPGVETLYAGVSVIVNVILTCAFAALGAVGIVAATGIGIVVGSCYLIHLVHQRVSAAIPGFLREVPVVSGLVSAVLTFGVGWVMHPHLPTGTVGLLLSGLAAIPGLAVFFMMAVWLKPRLSWNGGAHIRQ